MFTKRQVERLEEFSEQIQDNSDLFKLPDSTFGERDLHARDLAKLPTLITAGSLALVLNGCRSIDTVKGVNQIVAGRTGDLLDGLVARVLDQSSDAGAIADTVADKAGMLAIAESAWRNEAIPKPILATIMGRQGLNAALTVAAGYRYPKSSFRPTKSGKIGMAADNVAFIGYLYANALEREHPELNLHQGARHLGQAAFAASSAFGTAATGSYIRRVL